MLQEGSLLIDCDSQKDSTSASALPSDVSYDFKHLRSSSKWNEEFSPASSTVTESTQALELNSTKLPAVRLAITLFNFFIALYLEYKPTHIILHFLFCQKVFVMRCKQGQPNSVCSGHFAFNAPH